MPLLTQNIIMKLIHLNCGATLCNTESRQPIQCLKFIAPVRNIVYAQRLTISQQTLNRIQQNILRLIQHCYFPQHLRKESLQACVEAQTRERQGMQFALGYHNV